MTGRRASHGAVEVDVDVDARAELRRGAGASGQVCVGRSWTPVPGMREVALS
ncbi:hypothetical protein ACWGIV_06435 [Streptomyces sp. NPDC054844]